MKTPPLDAEELREQIEKSLWSHHWNYGNSLSYIPKGKEITEENLTLVTSLVDQIMQLVTSYTERREIEARKEGKS